jgi:hypothetical protein
LNIKKHIVGKVFAILLNLALLIPVAVQFLHLFENHEHTACNEIAVHLHKKKIDCSIYNFTFSAFDFEIITGTETFLASTFMQQESTFESLKHLPFHNYFQLRGPPVKA